jgi:hypothetical protein
MGCVASTAVSDESAEAKSTSSSFSGHHWRTKLSKNQYRKVYIRDGTLPKNASDGVLALRVFLEDPVSIVKFAEYAKRRQKLQLLLCWVEILEYKKIEGSAYRLSQATHLYHRYISDNAAVKLDAIHTSSNEEELLAIKVLIRKADEANCSALPAKLFDKVGQDCLVAIYEEIYKAYRQSYFYELSLQSLKHNVNHVGLDDFEYMEFLGQGSFGIVVHCKKKTTGKHYAMKLQTKVGLLETFSVSPEIC